MAAAPTRSSSSLHNLLILLLLLTTSLLVQAQTKPYTFAAPSTYQDCAFDPNVGRFIFLDARIGMPLVYSGGAIQVGDVAESTLNDAESNLTFSRVDGVRRGTWDLILHDPQVREARYLSVYDDGLLGYEAASSGGQQWMPAANGSRRYISTVWGLECAGNLRAGIHGSGGYEFDLFLKNTRIVTHPQTAGGVETVILGHELIKFGPLQPLVEPLPNFPSRGAGISRRSDGFGAMSRRELSKGGQRCDPPKVPKEKDGARPPGTNGCGPSYAMHLADGRFGQCCDGHDLCYAWQDCNETFSSCMRATCFRAYPSNSIRDRTDRLGCLTLAAAYGNIVRSPIGLQFYHRAGEERCECEDPDPGPLCPPAPENCCALPDHSQYCCLC